MKILFLSRLYSPHIGGVERHVAEVSKELIKLGHSVIVITENHGWEREEVKDGIRIKRIDVGGEDGFKKFRIWRALWELRDEILAADVVHCHDVFFWYLPFRVLFPYKLVYITFHGYEGFPIKETAILVRKISEKLSDGNICIGKFIEKWYGTKANYISYGGVAIPKEKKKYKKNAVVFVGRIATQTGIPTYLQAFHMLQKKYSDFTFTIVGDGDLQGEKSIGIKYVGFQEKTVKYLQESQFVFASGYLSILEAMATKRLVFAVYDDALKEDYLRMTPFAEHMTIAHSAEEIFELMEKYISSPELEKEQIEKAYAFAKKQTWKSVTDLYLQLWHR